MITKPSLSIVTISFNQAPYLRACLDSVLSQKDADTQYIVVDPGSTDGSRDILADYADRIDVVVLEPDEGPADGLNRGFARATGDIGYFINSDDFLLPGAIARLKAAWRRYPQNDVILGRAWLIDGKEKPITELLPSPIGLSDMRKGRGVMVQQGLSFRMDLFRDVGGFNKANRTCWDYELLCRFSRKNAIYKIVSDRIAAFRMHGDNISSGVNGVAFWQKYLNDKERIIKEVLGETNLSPFFNNRIFRHITRTIIEPRWFAKLVAERCIPGYKMKRWLNDFGRPHNG